MGDVAVTPEAPAPEPAEGVKGAAERVRSSRSEQTKAGMDRARRAGKRIGRPPKRRAVVEDEPEDGPATPEEVAGAALLGGTVWALAGPMFGLRELTAPEAQQLGAALAPVVRKYLPLLGEWQAEVNLILVVAGLYSATRVQPREVSIEPEPEPAPEPVPVNSAPAPPRDPNERMRVR
jgi:hypothetical protein